MRLVLSTVVAVLLACAGCQSEAKPSTTATTATTTTKKPTPKGAIPPRFDLQRAIVVVDSANGPQRFRVELAIKDEERQRGLMYREHLDDDEGMLFLFERQEARSFWMRNTYLPLDMLFIDEDLVVQGIVESAEPLTTTSRKIAAPTRHVLELNGGTARKLGIGAGSKVTFEGVPAEHWQKTTTTNEKATP